MTLDEFTSAQASFAFFGDSMHCTYGRTDAVAGQADSVTINGVSGMTVSSADAVVKHVSLKTTIEEASDEKVFQVDGLGISKGDPISMKSRRAGQISLAHNGTTPATYDLNIRLASANGEKIFSHAGITLPGNATVTIVPHWSSFSGDSTMLILIDHGNTGTPNDSIVISNEATGVNELKQLTIPKYFSLSQNYPNPFNPTTMLNYGIPEESYVHLTVYNTLGQLVASLVDAVRRGGLYQVRFTNPNLSSGIYFYRLDATSIQYPSKHFSQTRKMLLVK